MSSQSSILIISNSVKRQQRIKRIVSTPYNKLMSVTDSAAAITLLKEVPFDIVISDTDIGELDGWRLARMLRANLFVSKASTPFLLITNTHCEHIAETTAMAFSIDQVVAEDCLEDLQQILLDIAQRDEDFKNAQSVLIVEDDPDIAELSQRILKQNYRVSIAKTGTEGLKIFQQSHFDIVLLDVQLPEMSGPEVLARIMEQNPSQAVVIMTAHGGTDLAEQLMISGAVDFISKPFKADQLRKVISIAAHRENYLKSNAQFEEKVLTIKRGEDQYKLLSDTHTRLLDHLSTAVMELDSEGKILFANDAWTKLTGFSGSDTQGRYLAPFSFDETSRTADMIGKHLELILNGRKHTKELEFQLEHKSGGAIWVQAIFNAIVRNNQIVGITATIDNIDGRKKAEMKLSHLASHDTLTDLYNRHFFDEQLTKLSEQSITSEQIHSLLYIDLDHFKVINDTQGHHQGDKILKQVATKIAGMKRRADIVCRIGGDEFALLLPPHQQTTGPADRPEYL